MPNLDVGGVLELDALKLRSDGDVVPGKDVVHKDTDDDAEGSVAVEVGLGVRALEAELLESILVAVEPEERSLLDALERLLELDDVAWAGEAGRHLGVNVRLREDRVRVDLVGLEVLGSNQRAENAKAVDARVDAKTSV